MMPLPFTVDQIRILGNADGVETWTALNDPGPHLGYMIGARREYAVRCGEDYPDDASDRVPVPFPIGSTHPILLDCLPWDSSRPKGEGIEVTDMEAVAVRVERREGAWGFVTTWRKA